MNLAFTSLLTNVGLTSLNALSNEPCSPSVDTLTRTLVEQSTGATEAFIDGVSRALKVDAALVRAALIADGIKMASGHGNRGVIASSHRRGPLMPTPAKRVVRDGGERGEPAMDDRARGERKRTASRRMVLRTAVPLNVGDSVTFGYGAGKTVFTVAFVERDGDGFLQRLKQVAS